MTCQYSQRIWKSPSGGAWRGGDGAVGGKIPNIERMLVHLQVPHRVVCHAIFGRILSSREEEVIV
jgi:hypothetical protein